MSTSIATKIAALSLALLMNATLMGSIAYLFAAPSVVAGVVLVKV